MKDVIRLVRLLRRQAELEEEIAALRQKIARENPVGSSWQVEGATVSVRRGPVKKSVDIETLLAEGPSLLGKGWKAFYEASLVFQPKVATVEDLFGGQFVVVKEAPPQVVVVFSKEAPHLAEEQRERVKIPQRR